MKLLLLDALRDTANQRFMFADETTIPAYPPTVVYQQFMLESRSRMKACLVRAGRMVLHTAALRKSPIIMNIQLSRVPAVEPATLTHTGSRT